MPRFRNDTGSVLHSADFGAIPVGEFEADGYDPEVHGVIPGCIRLDAPEPGTAGADEVDGDGGQGEADATAPELAAGDGVPPQQRKRARGTEQDKEPSA